jgi:ParB-like chromosome segregation protein Spo0J
MLKATEQILKERKQDAQVYAHRAFRKLADVICEIQNKCESGKITREHAQALLRIGRNTAISVLLAVKGLSQGAAEDVTNAALSAVKVAVNEALGWMLL